jgi:hypothetical protein
MLLNRCVTRLLVGGLVTLFAWQAGPGSASAALIRPAVPLGTGPGQFGEPALSGGNQGALAYAYDASSGTGLLTFNTRPNLLSTGPLKADQFGIGADVMDTQRLFLSIRLDADGRIVAGPDNQFEVRGRVETGGVAHDGVLLHGRLTGFGAQDLDPLGVLDTDYFDASLAIDGGALASKFTDGSHLRFITTTGSTFAGAFDSNFGGQTPKALLLAAGSQTVPIPEPTTLAFAAAGLAWLVRRHRRRGLDSDA